MINRLKAAWRSLTTRVTLRDTAIEELLEAQRKRMVAQAGLEFAQAVVAQHEATIARLRAALTDGSLIERDAEITPERAMRKPRAVSAAA